MSAARDLGRLSARRMTVARAAPRVARSQSHARASTSPARRRALGELEAVRRATERLWRRAHLTYDDTREIAKWVRRRLELSPPAVRRGARPRLVAEQIGRFLAAAYRAARSRRGGDGVRARGLLVKTLLLSGARVAEFVRLRAEDLDAEGCELLIHGKRGKVRRVPILPELAHELRTHLGRRRAGWLFETVNATAYSTRRVQYIVKEIAEAAGIEQEQRVYPHLLRHTIAQHLLDRGMPVDQVRQFLGHDDIRTTQIYAEASPTAVAAGYRQALGGSALSESWARAARAARAEDVAALRSLGLVVRPALRGAGGAGREPRDRRARPRGKEARPGQRRRGGPRPARARRATRGRSS